MIKLAPVIMLLALVSCNDSMRTRRTLNMKTDTLNASSESREISVGQITNTLKTGNTLSPVKILEDGTLARTEIHTETFGVVLKIESNTYYEYQEIKDIISDSLTRRVVKKHLPQANAYEDLIRSGHALVSENEINFTNYQKANLQPSKDISIKYRQNVSQTVSISRHFCESRKETEEVAFVYKDEREIHSDLTTTSEVSSCEGLLSANEMSRILLKTIDYCDLTTFGSTCVKSNMSFLKN